MTAKWLGEPAQIMPLLARPKRHIPLANNNEIAHAILGKFVARACVFVRVDFQHPIHLGQTACHFHTVGAAQIDCRVRAEAPWCTT